MTAVMLVCGDDELSVRLKNWSRNPCTTCTRCDLVRRRYCSGSTHAWRGASTQHLAMSFNELAGLAHSTMCTVDACGPVGRHRVRRSWGGAGPRLMHLHAREGLLKDAVLGSIGQEAPEIIPAHTQRIP